VQWDKDDCADMGIVKVDLLGLGMMAVLQDALALVNRRPGPGSISSHQSSAFAEATANLRSSPVLSSAASEGWSAGTHHSAIDSVGIPVIDLAHLPQDDPVVYRMLCEADTVGVFQVESRAQMATLPRLKPTKFYDLVVQVAIIRPGPIVGQMVHPYLNRRAGREAVAYAHPLLEPVLARTLGVPLFQEQLLRMAMVVAGFTGGQAEELRRAMGFKRSEKRMKQIEVQLREGMAGQGIAPDAMEQIILSITSFALYGFPESHAASFALLAYASAYLKVHFPSAFYTALLNNQPMGFYHPSTLVKDAQRRGVRFLPIDVQSSDWNCTVEPDGSVRLGLRYVNGLRAEAGKAIASIAARPHQPPPGLLRSAEALHAKAEQRRVEYLVCPKCGCDDPSMLELVEGGAAKPGTYFCNSCSHDWAAAPAPNRRYASLDELIARTGLTRAEIVTLADIGALNSFGYDRREALWQAERAARPSGALFSEIAGGAMEHADAIDPEADRRLAAAIGEGLPGESNHEASGDRAMCPLKPMTEAERIVADYAGTGLTAGRHPMALRRHELAMRGVMPAIDLRLSRQGRRVRVAGMVITRQRPGTAKGFVFLTLEDETGIANIIVRPDLFARDRAVIVEEPFLMVEGVLQNQDGVTSIRAELLQGLSGPSVDFDAHDFY
jgi:error-prone DNA polymerase